jgi:hypothetical protein
VCEGKRERLSYIPVAVVTSDVRYRYFILLMEILTNFVLCELNTEVKKVLKLEVFCLCENKERVEHGIYNTA